VRLNGAAAEDLALVAPPFWTVKKTQTASGDGQPPSVRFTLSPPKASLVREVDLTVTLTDGQGNRRGELYYRCPASD
jgi:hypothetical protein